MNLSEAMALVIDKTKRDDSEAPIKECVLDAIVRIQRDATQMGHNFKVLHRYETANITTRTHIITEEIQTVENVAAIITNRRRFLRFMPERRFDLTFTHIGATGTPTHYTQRMRDSVEINKSPDPVAGIDIELNYYIWHPVLVLDEDEILFTRMDDVVITGAIFELYNTLNLDEMAMKWAAKYNKLLRSAVLEDDHRRDWHERGRQFMSAEKVQKEADVPFI